MAHIGAIHQEQVPRKQGLKPTFIPAIDVVPAHQEQVPRKQGLKQGIPANNPIATDPSRTSSTKTRIETHNPAVLGYDFQGIKNKFHENKD